MARKSPAEMYEEAERALVADAIAETEQEIFDEALGNEPDENDGDRSLEEMDGEDVLDDDDIEGESEDEETGEQEGEEGEEEPPETRHDGADRQDGRRGVPPGRLREEAEARRVAEAERGRLEAEARELRARLDRIEARERQQGQGQDQNQPPEPDMFADPEGWARHQRETITREFNERRINASMADAEEEHGDAFREAFQALQAAGNPQLVASVLNAHNPGRALMRLHQRATVMSEIGDDPVAYRQRLREELLADPEFRREVITGARSDAMRGDGGRPRTQTRLPPSLNSATGGTSHRGDIAPRGRGGRGGRSIASEERDIFESAFIDD